jgi:hypothetical protein
LLRHLDRITDKNLVAMKRKRATDIADRRVLIDFHGSGVVGRTRDVGSGSAGFDQRDFDTELRDFRNDPLPLWLLRFARNSMYKGPSRTS